MPFTLADSTIYNDGQNFNTEAHARNLYNPTQPRRGVYSKLKGRINLGNLPDPFVVTKDYIWPNLMASAFGTSSLVPVEYFSSASPAGGSPISYGWQPQKYGTIAGSSVKFFLPYASICLIDVSCYMSIWRPFYVNDGGKGGLGDEDDPERKRVFSKRARLRMVVDGDVIQTRGLPFSAQMSPCRRDGLELSEFDDKESSQGDIRMHEVTQGFYYSMHAQKLLAAGWHEAHLDYRLEQDSMMMYATLKRGSKLIDASVVAHSRLFCGIRNARVLALHTPLDLGSLDSGVLKLADEEETTLTLEGKSDTLDIDKYTLRLETTETDRLTLKRATDDYARSVDATATVTEKPLITLIAKAVTIDDE